MAVWVVLLLSQAWLVSPAAASPTAVAACGGGGGGFDPAAVSLEVPPSAGLVGAGPPRHSGGRKVSLACATRDELKSTADGRIPGAWLARCVLLKHVLEGLYPEAYEVDLRSTDELRASPKRYDVGVVLKMSPSGEVARRFDHTLVDVVDADAFGRLDRNQVRLPGGASVIAQNPAHAKAWCGGRSLRGSGGKAFVVEHMASLMNASAFSRLPDVRRAPGAPLRVLTVHQKSRFSRNLCVATPAAEVAYDCEERDAADRAGNGCEHPNFTGSYLGRFPLAFWLISGRAIISRNGLEA